LWFDEYEEELPRRRAEEEGCGNRSILRRGHSCPFIPTTGAHLYLN
jgi:hypothetical protein